MHCWHQGIITMSPAYNRVIRDHVSRSSLAIHPHNGFKHHHLLHRHQLSMLIIGFNNWSFNISLVLPLNNRLPHRIICSESCVEEILMKCFDKCGQALIKLFYHLWLIGCPVWQNHWIKKNPEKTQLLEIAMKGYANLNRLKKTCPWT